MDSRIRPGDVLAEKYVVERVIGEGGMGVVLVATHRDLGRKVAVKVLRGGIASGDMVARFQREAKAAAMLSSDHVAHVFDVGITDDHDPYIILEYLDGSDLASTLAAKGRLPAALVAELVSQTCEAIGEAHAHGIVHRDLKPSNLFLTRTVGGQPRVKVLDFGISKLREQDIAGATTQSSMVLGTPLYMAPEQMMSSKDADTRADIWSLGVVMFELLTGTLPWKADNVAALAVAITTSVAPTVVSREPSVPDAMSAVVARCLSQNPHDRFQSAADLALALEPLRGSAPTFDWPVTQPPSASPDTISGAKTELANALPTTQPRAEKTTRRGSWLFVALTAAIAIPIVVAFATLHRANVPAPTLAASIADVATPVVSAPPRHMCEDQSKGSGTSLSTSCEADHTAWCDASEHRIACCSRHLVAAGTDGLCVCPPGGVRADAGVACPPSRDHEAVLADFKATFHASLPDLFKCKRKEDSGRVVFWLDLTPDGTLFQSRIKESSLPDPNVQACFLRVVRALKFPPPPDGAMNLAWPIDITKD